MTSFINRIALIALLGLAPGFVLAQAQVDSSLPEYRKTSGVSGNLSSVGSDTLANLMTLWAEEFKRVYPNVNVQIQAAGSSTAPPALTEGTSNLGPMSRLMKDNEIQAFEQRHGYKPTPIAVAIDALAVFVHKDNPIEGLTLRQIDAVFSSTRTCGGSEDVLNWGQLGLPGAWASRGIQLYGRNSVSGTYGIGYSGIGYTTSSVRAVPLASEPGKPFVEATPDNAINGSYPLARFLYVYVNKEPGKDPDPITRQFLTMILSQSGQAVVVKDGYIPLPAKVAARELAKID
jgi:phosphate transport system substrate-binding protein